MLPVAPSSSEQPTSYRHCVLPASRLEELRAEFGSKGGNRLTGRLLHTAAVPYFCSGTAREAIAVDSGIGILWRFLSAD